MKKKKIRRVGKKSSRKRMYKRRKRGSYKPLECRIGRAVIRYSKTKGMLSGMEKAISDRVRGKAANPQNITGRAAGKLLRSVGVNRLPKIGRCISLGDGREVCRDVNGYYVVGHTRTQWEKLWQSSRRTTRNPGIIRETSRFIAYEAPGGAKIVAKEKGARPKSRTISRRDFDRTFSGMTDENFDTAVVWGAGVGASKRSRNPGDQVIARWETKGNDWIELYKEGPDYFYRGKGMGGVLRRLSSDRDAIAEMERPWGKYGAGPVTVLKTDRPSLRRAKNPLDPNYPPEEYEILGRHFNDGDTAYLFARQMALNYNKPVEIMHRNKGPYESWYHLQTIKPEDVKAYNPNLLSQIRAGDRVTIMQYAGRGTKGPEYKEATGRAVMRGPHGWVLNMGGRYGTPGIADEKNIVRVSKGKRQ